MQQLLPVALRGLLPDNFTSVLFDLCAYFREVSAKVLHVRDLEKLEQRIKITLCRMEMIFPPGFFTVMVHLVLHLATEAKIGGPVAYRSMWFLERYFVKMRHIYFLIITVLHSLTFFVFFFHFLFMQVSLCPEVICA